MLVYHGTWIPSKSIEKPGYLFIWAESSELASGIAVDLPVHDGEQTYRSKGNSHKNNDNVDLHPFGAPVEDIIKYLGEIITASHGTYEQESETGCMNLLLPSFKKYPLPSWSVQDTDTSVDKSTDISINNDLTPIKGNSTHELDATEGKQFIKQSNKPGQSAKTSQASQTFPPVQAKLIPWKVKGIYLPPHKALQFLLACRIDNAPTLSRIRSGQDMIFWAKAGKFVIELMAKEKFFPCIELISFVPCKGKQDREYYKAQWKPLLERREDLERINALIKAMPPVCRAAVVGSDDSGIGSNGFCDEKTATPGQEESHSGFTFLSSRDLLMNFINNSVDYAAKHWLSSDNESTGQPDKTDKSDKTDMPEITDTDFRNSSVSLWLNTLADAPEKPQKSQITEELQRNKEGERDGKKEIAQKDEPTQEAEKAETKVPAKQGEKAEIEEISHGLKPLYKCVQNWLEHLHPRVGRHKHFRTCFMLEPPDNSCGYNNYNSDTGNNSKNRENRDNGDNINNVSNKSIKQTKHSNDNIVMFDEETSGKWSLEFYLQSTKDLSLLIPAEKIWQETGDTAEFLNKTLVNPQENLLEDLGHVAELYPPVNRSLQAARPSSVELSDDEVYHLLREAMPLLEDAGYGVLVPSWWTNTTERRKLFGAKLHLNSPQNTSSDSIGCFGLDSILSFDWEVALGDKTLSREDLQRLVDLKLPLVKVRGQWIELRPEEVKSALKLMNSRGDITLRDALRKGLVEPEDSGLAMVDIEASGEIKEIIDSLTGKQTVSPVTIPVGFHGKLRPYQKRGLSWMSFLVNRGLGACLADDMGLGKTIQFIALMLHLKEQGTFNENNGQSTTKNSNNHKLPTILFCPVSVLGNWKHEVRRFAPSSKVMIHHGPDRLTGKDFIHAVYSADLVITTYSLSHRDEEDIKKVNWAGVILDEAQNIKNPYAKKTRSIRKLSSHYRVALTGTPVENRLLELWSIMQFLNPGYLGTFKKFREQFARPIERYNSAEKVRMLSSLTRPFILRRVKSDPSIITDLPEKQEMKVYCPLTEEQASLYQAVVDDIINNIEKSIGMERRGRVLAALTKLKQVCNHPAHFLKDKIDSSKLARRSGKLTRLEEMLEEVLSVNDRALIFTQFQKFGDMLKGYLQEVMGVEALFLHGGIRQKERESMIRRFQSYHDGPNIFILSIRAGGVGLNLTRANHVFHFDRWWNPAVEDQATDRVYRIGQKQNVQVHKFICAGTLEEKIDYAIEKKKALAESIVGSGEEWITEMSTDQLKELFSLSKDVIGT